VSSGQAIEDIYPLSPMQQGMLFHILHTPDAGLNVLQMSCLLAGDLDAAAFRRALARVIERHAVLRTSFLWEDVEQPLQVVDREVPLPLDERDWSGLSPAEQRRCLDAYLKEDLARGFDLGQAPLMRVLLAREGPGRHRLVWSLQMILFDGWSMPAVVGEVLLHYEAFRAGEDPRLAVPRHYRDYIAWLLRRDAAEAERFWRGELAGFAVPTSLPGDRGPGRKPAMAQHRIFLSAEDTAALQALARAERLTLSTLVQGGWALLMARSSGERDVVYGVTVSGRPPDLPGVESMIGLFINTLPARVRTAPEEPLVPWLRGLQERQAEARQYEHTPLVEVQGWSGVPRGLPLFDSLVVFENYPIAEVMRERSGSLAVDEIRQLDANSYPLTLEVVPGTRLSLRLTYDGARFTAATIEALLDQLSGLLLEMPARTGSRVGDLLAPTAEERRRLLSEWNRPGLSMPPDPPLHRLFEAAVDRAPEAPAVSCGGLETTYRELERRANRLARHLRRLGVGPEERVGLCAERSPDMVVGILGILKAGGAYVPLDPEVPAERLAYLLADSGVRALLTQERWLERLPAAPGLPVVRLDADRQAIEAESGERLADGVVGAGPENAAYVIYTSGSTGRPKGVVVTHANAARLLSASQPWFGFGPADVWTLFHSYAFDFSVWEIWGALAFGGRLVIVPYLTSRDPSAFRALLAAEKVTVLNQTPSAFRALSPHLPAPSPAPPPPSPGEGELHLRYVIFGGEALEPRGLAPWFARYGDERPRLVNMYGITETTVHVTYRPLSAADVDGPGMVGVPIPDLQVYLVDRELELLPPWAPGEICVGGDGVARGYLGRPELTAERFVPDPWSPRPGARLYRSGDLARWLPLPEGGDLEYLGRIDQQVKIRGFRIEPGEIEAVLCMHPVVREAAVVAREAPGGERRLVAYVVPVSEVSDVSHGELRAFAGERLPEYMVPAVFMTLAALPLTANGKLDRRALPAPGAAAQTGGEFVPPETPAEEALARVWAEVLGLERVGVLDSFFALGGDSILSIRVLARAGELGYALTLPQIFRHPTVRELARAVEGRGEAASSQVEPFSQLSEADRARLPEGLEDAYPLARLQAGMLFHAEYSPETAAYHDIFSTHLEAPFDEALLRRAVERVVAAHAMLRTSFDLTGFGEPLQLVHRNDQGGEPDLTVEDLRGMADQEAWLAAWIEEEKARPIDWTRAPMLRFRVHRRSEASFQLTLSFHHAILDGWSVAALMSELFGGYLALCRDGKDGEARPEPAGAYARYVALEREALASEASRRYWADRLAGAGATVLPRWPGGSGGRRGARSRETTFSPELSERLQGFARAAGVPLKSVLLAAHCRVLSWLAGQPEVVSGVVVNGRPEEEGGERVLGLFLNTLPFRLEVDGGTWGDLVRRVFAAESELLAHRRYPFAELQREAGGAPLFEAVFNFVHFHVYQGLAEYSQEIRPLGGQYFEETNFDFLAGFQQDPFAGHVQLRLQYEGSVFPGEQIEAAAGLYERALAALAEGPAARHDAGPPFTAAEREQLLAAGRGGKLEAAFLSVPAAFAAQAAQTPGAVAVVAGGEELTYGELDRRAGRLARRLRRLGIGRESRVGLLCGRGPELIVGLLGIWKAGGAYVPLDPSQPEARLAFMAEDAAVSVLVAHPGLRELAAALAPEVVWLGEEVEGGAGPLPEPEPGDLAYLIYTSGTTGRPKAVQVEHGSLAHTLAGARQLFGLEPGDRIPCLAPFSFDVFLFEVWGPLLAGGTTVLIDLKPAPDLERLVEELRDATLLHAVPALMRQIVDAVGANGRLRRVFVGGDAVPAGLLDDMRRAFPAARVTVLYGPTETAIFASVEEAGRALLGRPFPGCVFDLRDRDGHLAPVGTPAEIWVGGPGVARGYLRRPELTAERFVPAEGGGRFYRTGDLARRLPDGNVEFLGRVDQQVKVRGFRIEPGEVEAALAAHPRVRQAVVVVREEAGERRLVAYVVGEGEPGELRRHLLERLPDYMVPAAFVTLDALPLTAHGKVDRRALPAPETARPEARSYVPPRGPIEEMLAGLWAEVLGAERVGVHDDFFDLGGHSLLATQAVSRARVAFGVELPLRALFDRPTVAGFAAVVEAARRGGEAFAAPPLAARPRQGNPPLSFAQQRLWFFDQLVPGSTAYNMPVAVRFAGPLDFSALAGALAEVVRRHESLRTTFREEDGQPVQVIAAPGPFVLPLADLSGLPPEIREEEARRLAGENLLRPFDLARGPLFRPLAVRLSTDGHLLPATMHHIVSDGWSMGVFVREVGALYTAAVAGRPSPLPELPVQYADYAEWQRGWLSGDVLEAEIAWWRDELAGLPPHLELATDRPRPPVQTFRGASRSIDLGDGAALASLARTERATPFMTWLAGFQALLGRHAGQDDLAVGTPIAGRTRVELEGLIGFFANTLVLRGDLAGDPGFRELLGRARERVLGAQVHQHLPFEKLVEELETERDLSRTPLFQTMFVHRAGPAEDLEVSGLGVSSLPLTTGTVQFDLLLAVEERGGRAVATLEHNRDLYDAATAGRLLEHLRLLLAAAAADPDLPLSALPLLSESERHQLLEWNDTDLTGPPPVPAVRLFEAQAARSPEAPAVTFAGEVLTYAELDRRAGRLARRLAALGVVPESRVGLFLERSADLVVGMLGVWKAGGAWVPLDPAQPEARLAWMIEDAFRGLDRPVLVTQERLRDRLATLPLAGVSVVWIDGDGPEGPDLPTGGPAPEDAAYLIYTSGTTGRPKAVLIEQGNLAYFLRGTQTLASLELGDRVASLSPFSFDVFIFETLSLLVTGGTVSIFDTRQGIDLDLLETEIETVTCVDLVTALMRQMLERLCRKPGGYPRVRRVFVGGEAVPAEMLAGMRQVFPQARIFVFYGPTEGTVQCSYYNPGRSAYEPGRAMLGRPSPDTILEVRDRAGRLAPIGVPGELWLGGHGVGRGYLHQPELTAEKFPELDGRRFYRTGDLGRWLPDGNLEFLGRIDKQLKIRGVRIEPGEIEAAIAEHPGVRAAVVLARRDDGAAEARLVGYVVLHDEFEAESLREHLRGRLPEPMIPSAWVQLPALPLTRNGKVDTGALPAPERIERPYAPPVGEVEEALAGFWAELLRVERVGRHDSFFELGGHSLLAAQLRSRIQKTFEVDLPLAGLFARPTLADIAASVEAARDPGRTRAGVPGMKIAPRQRQRLRREDLE
jgi:amino acid adenylation domain-containing protein